VIWARATERPGTTDHRATTPSGPDICTPKVPRPASGAADIAQRYPQYSTQIIGAAKEAFLAGDQWAYLAGILAVLLGAALVFLKFPRHDEERRLLDHYHQQDGPAAGPVPASSPGNAPQPG